MIKVSFASSLVAVVVAGGCCLPAFAEMDRSRFNIGTYYLKEKHRSEQMVRDMKACGIDFVIYDFRNDRRAQDWLVENGMGCIEHNVVPCYFGGNTNVNGNIAKMCPIEKYVRMVKAHEFTPAEWMFNIGDELSALDFPHLGAAVRAMHRVKPDARPHLNLHPCFHKGKYIRTYLGAENYQKYIEAYCREMPLDYIVYDQYPYQWLSNHDWAFARYYENFRIVADACTATGRSFWFVPQVNTFDESVVITEDRLRYQAFAAMSFGAETLIWACWSPGWWKMNVLDKDGNKTVQYERLKKVNGEIRAFADYYMKFRRVGTHLTGFTGRAAKWLEPDPDNYLPQVNFNEPEGVSTVAFKGVRADDGQALVVGDFAERAAGGRKRAILLFAAEDPYGENPAERTVRFTSEREIRAVGPHGTVPVEQTGDCTYAVRVRSSECVFIVGR